MLRPTLIALLGLNLCTTTDETLTGYGASNTVWVLQTLDGNSFAPRATITFPEEGKITGSAPCNQYFAAQTAPNPWFSAQNIAGTKRACPELQAEGTFLKALSEMTISEVSATTLILSNDAKRSMIFRAE